MVVIVMGVTGTGKTTVGKAVAEQLHWQFADADDFHSKENRAKMHAGIALQDEDRKPWLESLHAQILRWQQQGTNAVLACSALKQQYRDTLAAGTQPDAVRYIFLDGPEAVIQQRLQQRHGHYMPSALLPSQLAALEPPSDAYRVSIEPGVSVIVKEIVAWLGVADYAEGKEKA
ncbi:MAG TPA: gluconokinase [Acidobacteriaceae bacterium]|jgi:gluconokinase|nr:gluconokinase [Acidobacteriaceae bacterium]